MNGKMCVWDEYDSDIFTGDMFHPDTNWPCHNNPAITVRLEDSSGNAYSGTGDMYLVVRLFVHAGYDVFFRKQVTSEPHWGNLRGEVVPVDYTHPSFNEPSGDTACDFSSASVSITSAQGKPETEAECTCVSSESFATAQVLCRDPLGRFDLPSEIELQFEFAETEDSCEDLSGTYTVPLNTLFSTSSGRVTSVAGSLDLSASCGSQNFDGPSACVNYISVSWLLQSATAPYDAADRAAGFCDYWRIRVSMLSAHNPSSSSQYAYYCHEDGNIFEEKYHQWLLETDEMPECSVYLPPCMDNFLCGGDGGINDIPADRCDTCFASSSTSDGIFYPTAGSCVATLQ